MGSERGLDDYFAEVLPQEKTSKIKIVPVTGDGPAVDTILMSLSMVIVAIKVKLIKIAR